MINITGLPLDVRAGAERALKTLGLSELSEEIALTAVKCEKISAERSGNTVTVCYKEKIHFFRALGLAAEKIRTGEPFYVQEEVIFKTVGTMPDLSNGAVVSVRGLCSFMDYMAVMGLNMLLLYVEDVYELPSRKYFGHMRGRYTNEELREIDDYGFDYGIEVIACMQTLGHLEKYLVWGESRDVKETARELNVDTPKTYEFIEEMLTVFANNLRSRRIHIGMDEVWGLGRGGASLKNYGLRDQEELFLTHLEKVVKITDKLGLRPMIWNDFVFCLHSESGVNKYDAETEVPKEVIARIPKNVDLVYWHYGEEVMGCDDHMIRKNLEFGNNVLYAGGLMMWTTPLPDNEFSYLAAEEGLLAAKKHGLDEVFTTLWCVGRNASDIFTSLLHLQQFAEHAYNKNVTRDDIARRFEVCTGASFEAFMCMSDFNNRMDREYPNYDARYHGQKFLWDDILLGKYDCFLDEPISDHYAALEAFYSEKAAKHDKWEPMYERCRALFDYLAGKTYISENLQKRYKASDKSFLEKCEFELIPELLEKTDTLTEAFREMWFSTRKAFGYEDLEERISGVRARIATAGIRLREYRLGNISEIEELEMGRLQMPESLWST